MKLHCSVLTTALKIFLCWTSFALSTTVADEETGNYDRCKETDGTVYNVGDTWQADNREYECEANGQRRIRGFDEPACAEFGFEENASGFALVHYEDGRTPEFPMVVESQHPAHFGIKFFAHDSLVHHFPCDELARLDKNASTNLDVVPESCSSL